jgi:hypothetical protein
LFSGHVSSVDINQRNAKENIFELDYGGNHLIFRPPEADSNSEPKVVYEFVQLGSPAERIHLNRIIGGHRDHRDTRGDALASPGASEIERLLRFLSQQSAPASNLLEPLWGRS